jgi:GTPase
MLTFVNKVFGKKKSASVCLVGEVNTGKSTLANRLTQDFVGKDMSAVSEIAHETRDIISMEHIDFIADGTKIDLTLVDTPGIATAINYKDFVTAGISEEDAVQRAKEATAGIISAIKFLDSIDVAILMMDATKTPFDQVSLTLMGTLEMKHKRMIIAANKSDLPDAKPEMIKATFPQHKVVPISALKGDGIEKLYQTIAEVA